MKKPFQRKSLMSLMFVVFMALVIGLGLSFAFSNQFYVTAKQRVMKNVYQQINEMYEDVEGDTSLDDEGYSELSTLCEENTISLLIINPTGTIDYAFGDSSTLFKRLNDIMFSRSSDDVKVISSNDRYVLQMHNGRTDGTGYVEIWGTLDNGNILIARSSYAGINQTSKVSLMFLCFVFIATYFFVSIMGILVIRPYTASLNRLLEFAQKANKGEFDVEYTNSKGRGHGKDEIGMIGDNITELSHKLEKTISELKTSNLKLEKELKGRIEQDEARRKYMSDVSHELKTPIALISGYAEGLKEGIAESAEGRDYYCDVIIDEAEKMNVMIKKLAALNQLENGGGDVTLERFSVTDVIDGFLNTMSIVIEEKGANIFFDNTSQVYVWSDEFLVEEVLMNYVNNAMNHMDERKIIRIGARYLDEKTVRVTVTNTGSQIPEEEQSKIWGKFYKVDKARTRAYGGSGLGLSIVKAVADTLGQECGVYNEEDGVSFWINLEAAKCTEETPKQKKKPIGSSLKKLTEIPSERAGGDGRHGEDEVVDALYIEEKDMVQDNGGDK